MQPDRKVPYRPKSAFPQYNQNHMALQLGKVEKAGTIGPAAGRAIRRQLPDRG
jgi:hypothetical protein